MCRFFSALGLPSGDILWHQATDSHADLVLIQGLDDTKEDATFAKLELVPPNDDGWSDVSKWEFTLDEDVRPRWVKGEMLAEWEGRMRSAAKKMIVTSGTIPIIASGVWLVGGEAVVRKMIGGRVVMVRDSASITDVRDSASITDVGGSASITGVRGSVLLSDSAKRHVLSPASGGGSDER